MDSIVTPARPQADGRFETARITAAVDALAAKHAGREDLFRAAIAIGRASSLSVGVVACRHAGDVRIRSRPRRSAARKTSPLLRKWRYNAPDPGDIPHAF